VSELCQRKIKDKPFINIVLDEHNGEAGLQTRIESFIDIISMKRKAQ
jgi:predicted nucleotide-binding protein (sugar kinase/HSP70/actin superfamily)